MAEDEEQECGFAYDHDLNLLSDRDGIQVYECRQCGAEIVDGDEECDESGNGELLNPEREDLLTSAKAEKDVFRLDDVAEWQMR